MCPFETIEPDDQALALRALAWTLGDPDRAGRLLALTGLDPGDLRARRRFRSSGRNHLFY